MNMNMNINMSMDMNMDMNMNMNMNTNINMNMNMNMKKTFHAMECEVLSFFWRVFFFACDGGKNAKVWRSSGVELQVWGSYGDSL